MHRGLYCLKPESGQKTSACLLIDSCCNRTVRIEPLSTHVVFQYL